MNPYDFVRIDWSRPPEQRRPVWHHRLVGTGSQKLYSGSLDVDIYTETPLFIPERRDPTRTLDPRKSEQFMQNKQGEYIIPGSSLKGILRSVVEALGNGCLTLFDGDYEPQRRDHRTDYKVHYKQLIDPHFQRCTNNTQLCIACRIFGMLHGGAIFLGKVNVGDARTYPDRINKYKKPIYTKPLMEPKPHHESFYLDEEEQHIAGRKFYFHHSANVEPLTASGPTYSGAGGIQTNRYIHPLDYDTAFHFHIDFTNLEEDEFGALLLAIILEDGMRHKIGYAKPLGLGSVQLTPTSLTLVDYAARYTQPGPQRGKTAFKGDEMWEVMNKHVDDFSRTHLVPVAMDDLRRIWRWPPNPDVDYYYPSKRDWFDTEDSQGQRIVDTRNVPRQG